MSHHRMRAAWRDAVRLGKRRAETFDLYCDYKNGNDAWAGTYDAPLKTITHALTHIGANQKIGLFGDSSDIDTYFREDGLTCATNGVTIKNVAGHTPVWVESTTLTVWAKTLGRANVYEASWAGIPQTGAANGATVLDPATDVANCDATSNSFYMDEVAHILYVNIGGAAPTAIEATKTLTWLMTVSGNNVRVDGLTLQWMFPPFWLTGTGCIVQNCTMRYQIRERTSAHLFIRVTGHDAQILDTNIIQRYAPRSAVELIEIMAASDNCLVDRCILYGGGGNALGSGVELNGTNAIVRNCVLDGNYYGVKVMGVGSGSIYKNTITDWVSIGIFLEDTATGTVNIYKNTMYLEHEAGGKTAIQIHGRPTVNVYHNTGYRLDHGGSNSGRFISVVPTADGMTERAKNNAMYISRYGITWTNIGFAEPTWDMDYNGFYQMATSDFLNVHAADQGTHNVTGVDPLYTGAPNYDLTLAPASPYIGAGVNIPGISEQNPATIGRYEYAP